MTAQSQAPFVKRHASLLFSAALVLVCVLAYAPGLTSPMTRYDDPLYLWDRPAIAKPGLDGFLGLWDSKPAWRGDFVEFFPLRDSVYWLVYHAAGSRQSRDTNPFPFHLASLGFHALATILAWRLARRLGLTEWAAGLTGLLFAVHPIHIESVTWVAGLKDPMYTSFMFGSLLAFTNYRVKPTPGRYAASLVLLQLALMVKSLAISTPLLMLGVERLVAPKSTWRVTLARLAGPSLLTGLALIQIVLIGRANHSVTGPHGGSWTSHAVLTLWAQVKYLKQALLPSSFRLIYCFEPPTGLTDPRFFAGLALLVGLVVTAVLWRRHPLLLFALGWYVAALLPASNLVPFPAIMADRYLYAPSYGVCLGVAMGLEALRRLRGITAGLVVVALLATTASRTLIWQDEEALWEEPDTDVACTRDDAFPAAQSHLLRYWASNDPSVRLLALERAIVTPGIIKTNPRDLCGILIGAAHEAALLGAPARGEPFALLSVKLCHDGAAPWNALTVTTMHRKPKTAAGSAERAWRLAPGRLSGLLRGLTRLELGPPGQPDPIALEWALDPVRKSPEATCPALLRWVDEVDPALAISVAEGVSICTASQAPPE